VLGDRFLTTRPIGRRFWQSQIAEFIASNRGHGLYVLADCSDAAETTLLVPNVPRRHAPAICVLMEVTPPPDEGGASVAALSLTLSRIFASLRLLLFGVVPLLFKSSCSTRPAHFGYIGIKLPFTYFPAVTPRPDLGAGM